MRNAKKHEGGVGAAGSGTDQQGAAGSNRNKSKRQGRKGAAESDQSGKKKHAAIETVKARQGAASPAGNSRKEQSCRSGRDSRKQEKFGGTPR